MEQKEENEKLVATGNQIQSSKLEPLVLYHWIVTTRQPQASTILYTYVLHSWYYMTQSHTQQLLSMCMPPCRSCVSSHSIKNSSPDILSEVLAACTLHSFCVLLSPENRSTLENKAIYFIVSKGAFLSKAHLSTYATVHMVMQEAQKKYQCERGGSNE